MENQDPVGPRPTPVSAAPKPSPDFPDLAKASFQFLGRFWLSYLKLGILLAIPAIVIMLVLGYFFLFPFLRSALGSEFEAHAAPALHSTVQVTGAPKIQAVAKSETAPQATQPTPDAVAPMTPKTEIAPSQEEASVDANTQKSVGVSPEGMKPNDSAGITPLGTSLSLVSAKQVSPNILSLLPMVALSLLFVLFVVFYQMIVVLSFARLTVLLERGEDVGTIPVVKWAIHKSGTYLMLVLRIFVYTLLWVPIVSVLVVTVLNFLAAAEIAIPGVGLLSFVFGLVSFVSVILSFVRAPRVLCAHYVLADRECASKEALGHSVEISMGHWWQIVLYLLGIGIVSSIVSAILSSIIGRINPFAGALVSLALSVLSMFYMVIFNFGLFRMLESQFKPQK
jgi:hypothetical protein